MTTQRIVLRDRLGTDISNRYQAAILRQEVVSVIDSHGPSNSTLPEFAP